MNLTEAIQEVKDRGASYLTDARITNMLNDAKNELEDFYAWPWLETAATGTAPLTIDDLKRVIYVYDNTQLMILEGTTGQDVLIRLSGLDISVIGPSGNEDPCYWYIDGTSTVSVYPANDTNTLYVGYTKVSDELTGTDEPLFPVRFHNLWVDLAMIRVYKDSDDFDRANRLAADCNQRLSQMMFEYGTRNSQNPTTQQITQGGDW